MKKIKCALIGPGNIGTDLLAKLQEANPEACWSFTHEAPEVSQAALPAPVADAVSVPVIASGGVGNLDHLADGVQQGGADAVLAASIFHYGEYTVAQAKARMAERGIPVRL